MFYQLMISDAMKAHLTKIQEIQNAVVAANWLSDSLKNDFLCYSQKLARLEKYEK